VRVIRPIIGITLVDVGICAAGFMPGITTNPEFAWSCRDGLDQCDQCRDL
jgi:hypothetical protein